MSEQVVTITFFKYKNTSSQWWAFKQMGLAAEAMDKIHGLTFYKMLGSGGKKGFSIWPNFSVYSLLAVWKNHESAIHFLSNHAYFEMLTEKSEEQWTIFMRNVQSHGQWDGRSPFTAVSQISARQPICVITRATIHTKYLYRFWRFVPPASQSVHQFNGKLFSIGIGELPLIQQATFSIWKSIEDMKNYAYQNPDHYKVIKKTRELGWYKEELFARFHPYKSMGTWNNEPILHLS